METQKAFHSEHLIINNLPQYTVQCLVLLIILKLEENLIVRKVHHLVYMNDLLKESLKVLCLLVLKDNIKEDDKLWTTVPFFESLYYGIWVDSFNWNIKGSLLGIFDSSNIGLSDNKILSVSKYSKLVE